MLCKTLSAFKMPSGFVIRTKAVLPFGSTQFNMLEEVGSLLLKPFSPPRSKVGLQQVYISIKQVVALCSRTPFKCSIARPPERVRVDAGSKVQEAALPGSPSIAFYLVFEIQALTEPGSSLS